MTKFVYYTYLGATGGTLSTPLLIEGAYSVKKYHLIASEGCLLTKDGVNFRPTVIANDSDINEWYEVPKGQN